MAEKNEKKPEVTPPTAPVGLVRDAPAKADVDPRDAELAALKAELAAVKESKSSRQGEMAEVGAIIGAEVAKALGVKQPGVKQERLVPPPLAEEHKGTKTYIVGPSRHYRNGRTYQKGEKVTVTDERPAKDWVLFKGESDTPTRTHAAPPSGRASDRSVG